MDTGEQARHFQPGEKVLVKAVVQAPGSRDDGTVTVKIGNSYVQVQNRDLRVSFE